MPLIACPDCQRQVSDIAPTCPGCGRPIAGKLRVAEPELPPIPDPPIDPEAQRRSRTILHRVIAGGVLVWIAVALAWGSFRSEPEPTTPVQVSCPAGSRMTSTGCLANTVAEQPTPRPAATGQRSAYGPWDSSVDRECLAQKRAYEMIVAMEEREARQYGRRPEPHAPFECQNLGLK